MGALSRIATTVNWTSSAFSFVQVIVYLPLALDARLSLAYASAVLTGKPDRRAQCLPYPLLRFRLLFLPNILHRPHCP
jgi:hypothetical protein